MGDVTVVVATYGDTEWITTAERAIVSASRQAPVLHVHGGTLAEARNQALARVSTEWVIHLDADDELELGYVDRLLAGTADVRAPAVRYVQEGRAPQEPYVPKVAGHRHDCTSECLPSGNYIVVGALARTQILKDVGGWEEWPVYEDWALWLRCWKAGATVESIPAAIYRAHVRPDSRNRAPAMEHKNLVHRDIVQAILP